MTHRAASPQRTPASAPSSTPNPTDYAGWKRNLVFIWLGVFVGLVGASFVFPFIPFYIEKLGVTDKSERAYWTGITASATGLSLTLTAPIWGSMADRFGRKPMFLRALVGAGILIGVMGLCSAVWQLVLLRFLMGAFAGTMGAAAALVAATTPREKTGQALGLLQTAAFSSSMLGPFAGGVVASTLGIRQSFFFCAALYVVAAVSVYFFVRESAPGTGPVEEPLASKRKPAASGSLVQNLRDVVSERQVIFMLGLLFCLNLSNTFVRPVQPLSIDDFAEADRVAFHFLFFSTRVGEELATGILFGVIGLTSTIAALCLAPLAQRIGYRNAVIGAAILAGSLYLPLAIVGSYSAFVLAFGAVGLFQGAMVPGTNALLAAYAPDGKHGSVFGLAASMQSLALLIGPLGGGFVSGTFGNELVYISIGVLLIAAGVAARIFAREPEARIQRAIPAS